MKPGDIFFFDVVPSQIWPLVTFTAIFIFLWGNILNMPKYGVRTKILLNRSMQLGLHLKSISSFIPEL